MKNSREFQNMKDEELCLRISDFLYSNITDATDSPLLTEQLNSFEEEDEVNKKEFQSLFHYLAIQGEVEKATLVYTACLIKKFITKSGIKLSKTNIICISIIAMSLSLKYLQDNPVFFIALIQDRFSLEPKKLFKLEILFLAVVDYNLSFSKKSYLKLQNFLLDDNYFQL